jgi:hypothetical protein
VRGYSYSSPVSYWSIAVIGLRSTLEWRSPSLDINVSRLARIMQAESRAARIDHGNPQYRPRGGKAWNFRFCGSRQKTKAVYASVT